jgi:hypothetical protein
MTANQAYNEKYNAAARDARLASPVTVSVSEKTELRQLPKRTHAPVGRVRDPRIGTVMDGCEVREIGIDPDLLLLKDSEGRSRWVRF